MKRRRRRFRKFLQRLDERVTSTTLWLSAFGLGAFFLCLEIIGPPPRFRIDALWVLQNARAVRVMIVAIGVAAVMSALLIFTGRARWTILGMWSAAIALSLWMYWDRIEIIRNVVIRHVL